MTKAAASHLLPVFARADLAFESGEGAWLVGTDGERYLDFTSGVAVNALGHCHPHLVAALQAQAAKLWHMSNLFKSPDGERLAARLCEQSFADFVFFANSGAEAMECVIKVVRRYHASKGHPERYRIITFEGAFHGRTLATLAATGSAKWHYKMPVPGRIEASAFGGGVSYSNGRVYATNGVGDIAALEAADGKVVWSTKTPGPLRGAPTIAFNAVFAMTQDNQVISLNAADGSVLWTKAGSAGQTGIFGVAAAAAGQGSVVAGYSTGEVAAYRYENGRELWLDALARTNISTEVGALTDVDADPIIDNGSVYALGQGGRMAAYELNTGQRIWELNLAGISTPAVAGDWIFTLTDDARLMAIARNTGKVRWLNQLAAFKKPKKRTGAIFWTGPVLAGNRLWIANSRGEVYSADVQTGQTTLFRDLNKPISLAPIVANQTLYILDDNGTIHAFR